VNHAVIKTARLLLRGFTLDDAPEVQRLAGDYTVARNTLTIPHPYEDGMAGTWIRGLEEDEERGISLVFAIERDEDKQLIGSIGLSGIDTCHNHAELGYWVGQPYWGRGYASEAASALVGFAFRILRLNRLFAYRFERNAASERVLEKSGFQREGLLRRHVYKWGRYENLVLHAILNPTPEDR